MGFAVRNLQTGLFRAWARWEAPAIDPEAEEVVEMDEAPELVAPGPTEVSPLQAKIALRRAGFLESVEAAVSSAGEEALIAYRNALVFRRDSPMLQLIAAAVPGLEAALDDIFTAAASIEV